MTEEYNDILNLDKCMRVIIKGCLHAMYEEIVERNRYDLLDDSLATLYVCLN